jgi:hypothetical protein
MPNRSQELHRLVRQALVGSTGVPAPDPAQLATAYEVLCKRLRTRLDAMFGGDATTALFARAHRLALSEFAWVANLVPNDTGGYSLDGGNGITPDIGPDLMAEGLAAVLTHTIALLSQFVGDDLIMPLVREAWGPASQKDISSPREGTP